MYAPSVILGKLAEFERKNGWSLSYHSLAEVEEFKAYIDSITKRDANSRNTYIELTTKLSDKRFNWVQRWIENEQALCTIDADYWETRYAYITDNASNIYKFSNRKSQEVFDSIIAQFDLEEVAIELLILKARQLGVSTKVALKFLHRLLFLANTQAVMASINADKSELLGRMIEVCLNYLPWWLVPRVTTNRIRLTEFDNGSILAVQSGSQATGIAQGWTPTLVHISEIGDIPNPKKVLEEGLFKATHPTRKLFAVYEGTGNGNTGWQADKWRACKEGWPLGRSRLCPIFLSWPCAPDQYPEPDWIRKFPIPAGWTPHAFTRKHVQRCELYIRHTDYLARVMGRHWEMSREQQWYWEFNYDEAVKTHTQRVWLSHMPADDFEALQGKNDPVFEDAIIVQAEMGRKREYQDWGIKGDSIDDGLEPDELLIDYSSTAPPRKHITWQSHRGQKYEWIMVPLRPCDDDDEKATLGRIRVWYEPKPDCDYSFGIDTADGLGNEDEDRSVLSIAHSVTGEGCDEQVCEFVHNRVNSPQMVGFAACLAAWYSQGEEGDRIWTRDPRGVKFCIEQRERSGDDCQLQLKLMGFSYHHIHQPGYDARKIRENVGHIEGFRTNTVTRPILTGRFVDAITNGWYKANSKWLIAECRDWERRTLLSGKTRMDHRAGQKDDRIIAAAQSYLTRHAFDVMADRSTKRYALPTGKLPAVDYSHTPTCQLAVDDWAISDSNLR
jgi:hypothetical protein